MHATQLEIKSGRNAAVLTPEGDRREADVFVNCTRCWVDDVVGNAPDLSIPMAPAVGFLAFMSTTRQSLADFRTWRTTTSASRSAT